MPKTDHTKGGGMAKDSSTTFKVSVLRCKKTGRVLFLEAGKDFVDTLLSFLLLPVGTALHMLCNAGGQVKGLQGGIACVYESVGKLDCSLMHADKRSLLQPRPAVLGSTGLLQGLEAEKMKRPTVDMIVLPEVYYRCSCNRPECLASSTAGAVCPMYGASHGRRIVVSVCPKDIMSIKNSIIKKLVDEVEPVEEATCSSNGQGFVRENITYMVTDKLEVMPSTTIRSISVLNTLKVATLSDLESTDSTVSITQILQLLRSALTSSSCLNDVFGKR